VNPNHPKEANVFAVKDLAGRAAQRVFGDFGTFMLRRTVTSLIGSDEIKMPRGDLWRSDAPFCTGHDGGHARSSDFHRAHS
jgi:hypothetical protein